MNFQQSCPLMVIALAAAVTTAFAEDKTVVPYERMERPMQMVDSRDIEGIDCAPFYLKHTKEGTRLDPEAAKFRIETAAGKTVILKCEALASIEEADRSVFEKKQIQDGFTHRLWIPKDPQKYARAKVVWDLPPQSVYFFTGRAVPFEAPPDPRED